MPEQRRGGASAPGATTPFDAIRLGPHDELPSVLPGTRYRLEELLGDGGAGRVYRAVHVELERSFAVKVLHEGAAEDPTYVARFRREAKAASSIDHPGVVAVTDFGTTADGRLFLVMEHVAGSTIADAVAVGAFEPRHALTLAAKLCDVLDAVHRAGVIHRDVKPANIFVNGDEVKLVDFGIARGGDFPGSDAKITRTGRVVGTPGYMAPEHARGRADVDGRADLYSVGVVLYEMLTGFPPFRGDSSVDVLVAQLNADFEPPSRVAAGVPRVVDGVVRRLLAVEPDARPLTAAKAASEIREIIERIPESGKPRTTRRWVIGLVAALALVLAAAAIALGLGRWLGAPRAPEAAPSNLSPPPSAPSPAPASSPAPSVSSASSAVARSGAAQTAPSPVSSLTASSSGSSAPARPPRGPVEPSPRPGAPDASSSTGPPAPAAAAAPEPPSAGARPAAPGRSRDER